jgi:anthrone oxygenase-like protein
VPRFTLIWWSSRQESPAELVWRLRSGGPATNAGRSLQGSLAVAGSVLAFVSAWLSRDPAWIVGGVLLCAVVPFTLLVIFPTNKKLQNKDLDVNSAEAERLLRLWNKLHAVRSTLSLLAFGVFLFALKHSGR